MLGSRFRLYLLFAVVAVFGPAACSSAQADVLSEDVAAIVAGDWARLPRIEIDRRFLRRVSAADRSVPYALGRVLEAAGRDHGARQVYSYVIENGSGPFVAASAVRSGVLALKRERWDLAAAHAATARAAAPGWADAWYVELEAAYRGRDWNTLFATLDDLPTALEPGELATRASLGTESLLWRAVWALQQQRDIEARVLDTFLNVPAHAIHARLYLFMSFRDQLDLIGENGARLADAVYRASRSQWEESARLFASVDPSWLAARLAERGDDGQLWQTLRVVLERQPDERAIAWLERLASEPLLADLPDQAARLALVALTASGARAEADGADVAAKVAITRAAEALARAATEAVGAEATLLWVRFADPAPWPAIERMVEAGIAPGPIADYLDRAAPRLVRAGDWDALAKTALALPHTAVEAKAMLAVILGAADRAGLRRDDSGLVADLVPFAERLGVHRNFGYPVWAVRLLFGDASPLWSTAPRRSLSADRERPVGAELVPALAHAGQWSAARRLGLQLAADARFVAEAEAAALALWEHGAIAAALDVSRRTEARHAAVLDDANLAVRFPLGYASEIRAAAEIAGIDAALLFAIVREESHFRPQAVSSADAQGLGQVLESTAEFMAARLGWDSWDLARPSDNLRLAAEYLAFIAERVRSPMLQVAAYNAGHLRGADWEAEFGSLPPLLQIEAIPLSETRWYVRKVLVSYLHYAALIHGDDARAAYRRFLTAGDR